MKTKTTKKKTVRSQTIRFKTYALFERAVEEGVAYGLTRAHKYTDTPTRDQIENEVTRAVMGSLDEIVVWEELYDDV